MRKILLLTILSFTLSNINAQLALEGFGKGLQFTGKDSSFYLKANFRFQTLFIADWALSENAFTDYRSNFLIRRARFKFDGWALTPKFTYKFEIGLSNRDIAGGGSSEFRNAPSVILDAWIAWNFWNNLTIHIGQGKLPGNRERLLSSGDLQFVDRSQLNSLFSLDRDVGIMLSHHFNPFGKFIMRETFAFSQGEGRNVTFGYFGGYEYTGKLEFLPFGEFQSKGDYVGGAIKREEKPKLAIATAFDYNNNAVRERGTLGDFIKDSTGTYIGKDVFTVFVDFMFKYKGLSAMGEFAFKDTEDGDPLVRDDDGDIIGVFYTGKAYNIQAGYMFPTNWEVAFRYTKMDPDFEVDLSSNQYTLAVSKYIIGHKLKAQTDFTISDNASLSSRFMWRTQIEVQF